MPLSMFAILSPWTHRVDRGVLLLVAALFLATILAHRYWREVIRLEDEVESRRLDLERALERYQVSFRASPHPAAFVDRVTGLVMEAAPGWSAAGLPAGGEVLYDGDAALEALWKAIPAPDAQHRPAGAQDLLIRGRVFTAEPLSGLSLGIVLVTAR